MHTTTDSSEESPRWIRSRGRERGAARRLREQAFGLGEQLNGVQNFSSDTAPAPPVSRTHSSACTRLASFRSQSTAVVFGRTETG